jgi:hypothetical protein
LGVEDTALYVIDPQARSFGWRENLRINVEKFQNCGAAIGRRHNAAGSSAVPAHKNGSTAAGRKSPAGRHSSGKQQPKQTYQ